MRILALIIILTLTLNLP